MPRTFPLLPTILIVLSLVACQTNAPATEAARTKRPTGPAKTATPASTPIPRINVEADSLNGLVIEVWHAFHGAEKTLFDSQVNEFNSNNPWKFGVRVVAHGGYADLSDSIEAGLEDGSSPDLAVVLPEQARGWSEPGRVVDLTPYIHDPDFGWTGEARADIPAVFLAQDSVDGQILGVPAERSARFLFYNQTWARQIGFSAPPTDSANFREQACAGNQTFRADEDLQNDGYGGWIVDTDPYTSLSWMMALGGGPVQDGAWQFAGEANEQAVGYLKDLYDDACAWLSSESPTYDQFANREALFASGSLGELPDQAKAFARAASGDTWTVLPFPDEAGGVVITYGPSYTVLKSTPEEQLAAWLFVRWVLEPENQVRWVKSSGLLPLRTSSLANLADYKATHPQWAAAVELIPQMQAAPAIPGWYNVKYMLGDAFAYLFRMDLGIDQVPSLLEEMDTTAADLASGKPW